MKLVEILIGVAVLAVVNAEYKQFKNYKVYRISPQSDEDVKILSDLQDEGRWNFWSDVILIGGDVRIMVDPDTQKEFEDYLSSVGLHSNVVIQDVQNLIDDQLRRPSNIGRSISEYSWNYYQNLDEINSWLEAIAAEYPDVVTLVSMGSSVEGRNIAGVKIDFKKQENATIGMIEGGIHAREWISPATVTWIIKEFVKSTDPDVRALAENIVWHIFPVVNPDGYVYTFTNNRMWRKNRNPANFTTTCLQGSDMSNGIDLNRNFGYLWMTVGASQNPCSETFAGPVEFSEPEAVAIANYVFSLQQEGDLLYYFAFHSYSQMVLVPYSHLGGADVVQIPNYADMFEIAIKGMDKLKEKHGTNYLVGTSLDILYPTSGGSFDWVKGGANVPIVYLFELRDVGQYGFLLPSQLIIPNNEEIMDGLVEMDRVARQLRYYNRSSASRFGLSAVVFILAVIFAL